MKTSSYGFALAGGFRDSVSIDGITHSSAGQVDSFVSLFTLARLERLNQRVDFGDPSVCNKHGTCDTNTEQCFCAKDWMGKDWSITHCFGITSNSPMLVQAMVNA